MYLIQFFNILLFELYYYLNYTPENASDKKLYIRIFTLIILCIFMYYMSHFSEYIYEGNYCILIMTI